MRPFLLVLFFLTILSIPTWAVLPNSSLEVFAVAPDGTALAAELQLKITSGSGKVWSSVSGPLVGTATQSTEKIAVKVALNYFPDAKKYDYFYTIESDASVVDGPSAGSAMALLTVSALQDKVLPDYVGLTGTITNTGEVGPVGGVFEKAHEASKNGKKLFLIPEGEARQVVKLEDGVQNIDLPEYALKNWNMKIVETANLDDVLKYAFMPLDEIDITKTPEDEETHPYIPPKIDPVESAKVLG
ncbi:MAG: S16 family serine protease, partial [archaeon]